MRRQASPPLGAASRAPSSHSLRASRLRARIRRNERREWRTNATRECRRDAAAAAASAAAIAAASSVRCLGFGLCGCGELRSRSPAVPLDSPPCRDCDPLLRAPALLRCRRDDLCGSSTQQADHAPRRDGSAAPVRLGGARRSSSRPQLSREAWAAVSVVPQTARHTVAPVTANGTRAKHRGGRGRRGEERSKGAHGGRIDERVRGLTNDAPAITQDEAAIVRGERPNHALKLSSPLCILVIERIVALYRVNQAS